MPNLELPRVEVSRTPATYQRYYSTTTRTIVEERFRSDAYLFDYEFDG